MIERICINCKFCNLATLCCEHPKARATNPVSGDQYAPLYSTERAFTLASACGRSGVLFQARETEQAA